MATNVEMQEEIQKFIEAMTVKYGPVSAEPGVALFTAIEDFACSLGDTIAQEFMRRQIVERGEPGVPCCPECNQPGLRKKKRRRTVATRRGPVELTEPECYCKRCRKSFFPSLGTTRPGS
jgi:hypothetical protein